MNETLEIIMWIVGVPLSWLLVALLGVMLHKFFIFLGNIMSIKEEKRVPCSFPMNKFYNFEDEIPEGVRLNTPEECEKCKDGDDAEIWRELCGGEHCLVSPRMSDADFKSNFQQKKK
jgi:hypothetical protein